MSATIVRCEGPGPLRSVECYLENGTTVTSTVASTMASPATNDTMAPSSPSSPLTSGGGVATTATIPAVLPTDAYACNSDSITVVYCTESNNIAVAVTTFTWSQLPSLMTVTYPPTALHPLLSTAAASISPSLSNSMPIGNASGVTTSSISAAGSSTISAASSTSGSTTAQKTGITSPVATKNTSAGEVAGAAIGCFIAGLLVAATAVFFLMRKRSNNRRYASPANYTPAAAHPYGGEKGTPLVAIDPLPTNASGLDFLPQQADDAEVRRKLSTVIDQIDQHVENFYANRPVSLTAAMEGELSRFETSQLSQPLAACFDQATQPTVLIKHCLAFHIFNLTMAPGEGTAPILPPELASMVAMVYHKSLAPNTSKDTITAFTLWKQLTSYLRPDLLRDPATLHASTNDATNIANQFTAVFTPWRNDAYSDDQRSRHLTELLEHAIHTAIWLFGQPDSYRFDWNVPTIDTAVGRNVSVGGRGRAAAEKVAVAPGVSKLTHGGVRLLGQGQQLLGVVVKRI